MLDLQKEGFNPAPKWEDLPAEYTDIVPRRTFDALVRYYECGGAGGSFLESLLCNNLRETVSNADTENLAALGKIVQLLHNRFPAFIWGAPERYALWLRYHREGTFDIDVE